MTQWSGNLRSKLKEDSIKEIELDSNLHATLCNEEDACYYKNSTIKSNIAVSTYQIMCEEPIKELKSGGASK